jgi:hypothetical protein
MRLSIGGAVTTITGGGPAGFGLPVAVTPEPLLPVGEPVTRGFAHAGLLNGSRVWALTAAAFPLAITNPAQAKLKLKRRVIFDFIITFLSGSIFK